ncbi:MAG: hypothetical protein DI542_17560 [Acinetobacter johnsonii]|uniref:Uncharacterized protein n=1 Tax=Acinetobacter johnsonii TaxID=40214 RepID=A0A2W5TD40_ACIJO|nr:MAG: hypothetical protein DI542_17560 [Acinetobacter johnsonii]
MAINPHRPGAGLGVLPDGAKSQKRGGSQGGGGAGQILGRSTRYSGTGQLQQHNILGCGGGQGAFGFWSAAKAAGKRTLPRCAYRPALTLVAALQRSGRDLSSHPLGWPAYPHMTQWHF